MFLFIALTIVLGIGLFILSSWWQYPSCPKCQKEAEKLKTEDEIQMYLVKTNKRINVHNIRCPRHGDVNLRVK